MAYVDDARGEWMRVGLSVERCDRPAAEAAVHAVYGTVGQPEPAVVVWMDSPLGGALAAAALKKIYSDQLGGQLSGRRRRLGDRLGGQLYGQLCRHLQEQLEGKLGSKLWEQLLGQLQGRLFDHLMHQLSLELEFPVSSKIWDLIG